MAWKPILNGLVYPFYRMACNPEQNEMHCAVRRLLSDFLGASSTGVNFSEVGCAIHMLYYC